MCFSSKSTSSDLLARPEGVVDDLAEPHVLELGAHERPALAGLDVLELDDLVRLPVEDDLQPLLELRGRHLHRVYPSVADGRGSALSRPLARLS